MEPYRRDTLELTIEGLAGAPPGYYGGGTRTAERLVMATLVWPRPLIAERVAARAYRFGKEGLDLADRDWTERILFKENVEGPFGLVVQVTEPLSSQEIARVAGSLGATLLRTAGAELARLAGGPWLTALARFPFTHMAGEAAGAGKVPRIAAAGRLTLLPGSPGPIELPLSVPEDVVRIRRQKLGGRVRTRREVAHRQGDPAGTVRLSASYYRA